MTDFTLANTMRQDPMHIGFQFARYKFVAKMLAGFENVAEVGAGDGILSVVVARAVGALHVTDIFRAPGVHRHNMVDGPFADYFDAVYALDVLEHIDPKHEDAFLRNICTSLTAHGTCIIGMPSAESQPFASEGSKAEHVNCKTEPELRETMRRYFRAVYLFGMNDEVLHTGFGPMCHYRFALCNSKRPLGEGR